MARKQQRRLRWSDSSTHCAVEAVRVAELRSRYEEAQLPYWPRDFRIKVARSRHYAEYNWFVGSVLKTQIAFYNFGLQIHAVEKAAAKQITEWRSKPEIRRVLATYAREMWRERLTVSNVVGLWRVKSGRPLVFPVEQCTYDDTFGIEVLRVLHKVTGDRLKSLQLPPAERDRLTREQTLELRPGDPVFGFDVLKRAPVGSGFGDPEMAAIFMPCAQIQALEFRDASLADAGRLVLEHWQAGHEVKQGPFAGSKANFCKVADATKITDTLRDKVGHQRFVTNFDRKQVWPGPDPEQFEAKRYQGALDRLLFWSMPVGHIIVTKTLNPYLMEVFRTQATAEREEVQPHLERVFNALHPPAPVRVAWSDRCFRDSKLSADMLKFALQWGPLSQTTFSREIGLDPDAERTWKTEEAGLPKAQTQPLVDANHGKDTGKKSSGRTPGTPDQTQ